MRVLQIILFKFLLGYILQAFTSILGLYAFHRQRIDKKKFLITSLNMAAVIFVTRLLPVAFGVHTVLNVVAYFLFSILYLHLPVVRSIISLIFIFIIIIASEFVSSLILVCFIGEEQFIRAFNDSLDHYITALPSSVLFALIISIAYLVMTKRTINKGYSNADTRDNSV